MIIVADHIAILALVERPLCLLANEIIREARAMHHLLGPKILNEIVARNGADDRQMIVILGFGLVRRAAGDDHAAVAGKVGIRTAGAIRKGIDAGAIRSPFLTLYGDSYLPINYGAVGGIILKRGRWTFTPAGATIGAPRC